MTGIELNEKLALFYAEYRATDHLLCHDDELEGRQVAFILYLTPGWTAADGGSLDLFAVGKIGASSIAVSVFKQTKNLFNQLRVGLKKSRNGSTVFSLELVFF